MLLVGLRPSPCVAHSAQGWTGEHAACGTQDQLSPESWFWVQSWIWPKDWSCAPYAVCSRLAPWASCSMGGQGQCMLLELVCVLHTGRWTGLGHALHRAFKPDWSWHWLWCTGPFCRADPACRPAMELNVFDTSAVQHACVLFGGRMANLFAPLVGVWQHTSASRKNLPQDLNLFSEY